MNKYSVSKFSLSYYSLTTQIIIINIITAVIGFIIVCSFNFYLLNNNKNVEDDKENIEIKREQINSQIEEISNYLETNAIYEIPQFNEDSGELNPSSGIQLDPYTSQVYIENKYLNQPNEIKIYTNDLIKYLDTKDLYVVEDVIEIAIRKNYTGESIFFLYKKFYLSLYNKVQQYFSKQQLQEIVKPIKNDINLIIETIKQRNKISKIFSHSNNTVSLNLAKPLIKNNKIYGVVLIKGFVPIKILDNETAIFSYNLFNIFFIIIFFMFLLSIFFTRSIIRPIKTLSFLANTEQDKFHKPLKPLKYPVRNDEIGMLSNDIKDMSKELKSQIYELEEFAADVAHELKNPLTSAKASNELLAENKITPQNRKLLFSNITKDLNRMNKLISDISEYTRTQAEIEKQKFDKFDLIDFINDLILSFKANKKEIKILFKPSDLKITIQANIDKLAQVFINIIDNAISFAPYKSDILIYQSISKNKVIIYIVDQGSGINTNVKNKIFERFYTDRSNKNEHYSGLGLSISKKIMESFEGSLELSEKIISGYNGACFKLEIPIKA